MIKTFIIKQTVKIAKKELDKRGGIIQVSKDVTNIVKSEVEKYDFPTRFSTINKKLRKKE